MIQIDKVTFLPIVVGTALIYLSGYLFLNVTYFLNSLMLPPMSGGNLPWSVTTTELTLYKATGSASEYPRGK